MTACLSQYYNIAVQYGEIGAYTLATRMHDINIYSKLNYFLIYIYLYCIYMNFGYNTPQSKNGLNIIFNTVLYH